MTRNGSRASLAESGPGPRRQRAKSDPSQATDRTQTQGTQPSQGIVIRAHSAEPRAQSLERRAAHSTARSAYSSRAFCKSRAELRKVIIAGDLIA